MKIEFESQDIEGIAQRVVELIRPMLSCSSRHEDSSIVFDVRGLSDYLKVDPSWVYKKVSLKEIPHFHAGKYPRFKKSVIDKWIENQTTESLPPLKVKKYKVAS